MTDLSKTRPANRPVAGLALLAGVAAALASIAAFGSSPNTVFLATGLWALAIGLVPIALVRGTGAFSPWTFALLTIGIGVILRGACLSAGFPDAERLDRLYLLGRSPAFFVVPSLWLLAGLGLMALGYVALGQRPSFLPRRLLPTAPDPGRLLALCFGLLGISLVATFLYLQRTGGFDAGLWSAKRTVIPDLELSGSGYQSHGGLRFLASLALYGHLLSLAAALAGFRWRSLFLCLAILLLGLACLVPFYASLRTTVAMTLVQSAALVFLSGHRLRFPLLGLAVVVTLAGIAVMTALRPSNPDRSSGTSNSIAGQVLEAAVINRNQVELPKTAHILAALESGELPRAHGKTIARWMLAPIPRSLWPDKPVIPPGPEIGRTVYGQRVAGVPPSLVAELAWNFGFLGILLGAFGAGLGLRWIDNRFRPRQAEFASSDRNGSTYLFAAALYVAGPMTLAFEMVGGSLGSGLFRAVLQTAVMGGLLLLVRRPRGGKSSTA